ncbi:succinate dehydrogenase [Alcaligenes endophyticus]|uniref:Succinate dehydrogenase n=1 Tax=Alcaligenes endophyticus TaxID=1929088 RepID=A0ABT8EM43_9BURK|nr:succinate dehydrogenase [Alcaligenes endophyticus]MCX5591046.1 succinate dehydrogenase [Alcaligenes endophyticus]MDN4122376.1 succinate dehydrogenase [Alcaligenes endophyticus]
MERVLFFFQRLTALILAPFVLIHLAVIMYAVKGGLTAADILSRTQGSVWWISFYGVFVIAVAIHAAIGIRRVLIEWCKLSLSAANVLSLLIALGMLFLGMRAVVAVGGL